MNNNIDYSKFFKNLTAKVEQETEYGVYVWKMPNGQYAGDGQGHLMMIRSRQGDFSRMLKLTKAAHSMGLEEGSPHYMPDKYPVSDLEHDDQRERMENGIMADPADPGNLKTVNGREYGR